MIPASKWILPLYISAVVVTLPNLAHAATQPDDQLVATTQTRPSNQLSDRERIAEQYDLNAADNHKQSSDYHSSYFLQFGDWGISTDNDSNNAIWRIAIALLQAF
ncbi:hypothetical protein ACE3MZ_08330 [Paenibacillus sp. WLX1005]|uniref:hypothetical protein n=1 Tax=Paenibacillus sp. WLX1005 TaxID=3243766 RepID=UPI003983DC26